MNALGLPEALALLGAAWLGVTYWLVSSTRDDDTAPAILDLTNRSKPRFPEPRGPVNRHGCGTTHLTGNGITW